MYEVTNEKIKFMVNYIQMFDFYFDDPDELERIKIWWKKQKGFALSGRRTTSIDLFKWDYDILDSFKLPEPYNTPSGKIRYLIKLGAIVHHLGMIDSELQETCQFLKKIEFSTDEVSSHKLLSVSRKLFGG